MENGISVECSNCGFVFENEEVSKPTEERMPCPKCGSLSRNIRLTRKETLGLHDSIRLEAKRPASKHKKHRADYELEEGKKIGGDGKLVYKKSIKDREHADSPHSYIEIVKDKDGHVIVNKDEKLSKHK